MKGLLVGFSVLCLALIMAIPCPAQVTIVKKGPLGRVRSVTSVGGNVGFAPVNGFAPRAQFNPGFGFALPARPLQPILLPDGTIIFR